ncbi:MAG: AIR synthase-related protein, partial [Chthoniobacterales bacterium]
GVVDPTPTIGMVGLIEDEAHITTQWFKNAGDIIILVGEIGNELGGSRFLKVCHGRKAGLPPRLDIQREIAVQNSVRDLIRAGLVQSAHDCSEGGLAVALAESCFNPDGLLGVELEIDESENIPATLFGESQSRIVISIDAKNVDEVRSRLTSVPFSILGKVGGDELRIRIGQENLRWPIAQIHDDWFNSIRRAVEEDSLVSTGSEH